MWLLQVWPLTSGDANFVLMPGVTAELVLQPGVTEVEQCSHHNGKNKHDGRICAVLGAGNQVSPSVSRQHELHLLVRTHIACWSQQPACLVDWALVFIKSKFMWMLALHGMLITARVCKPNINKCFSAHESKCVC